MSSPEPIYDDTSGVQSPDTGISWPAAGVIKYTDGSAPIGKPIPEPVRTLHVWPTDTPLEWMRSHPIHGGDPRYTLHAEPGTDLTGWTFHVVHMHRDWCSGGWEEMVRKYRWFEGQVLTRRFPNAHMIMEGP